jgi:hypothetical protein
MPSHSLHQVTLLLILFWTSCLGNERSFSDGGTEILQTFLVGSAAVPEETNKCQCDDADEITPRKTKESSFMVELDMNTAAATLKLEGEPWFHLTGNALSVVGWNDGNHLRLSATSVIDDCLAERYERFGSCTNITFLWEDKDEEHSLETSFLIFHELDLMIFEQYFPNGWEKPEILTQMDDTRLLVTGFPTINLTLPKDDLAYMSWGGCMLSNPSWGDWKNVPEEEFQKLFDADSYGQPWVLHDPNGRTVVWSSLDNFFVSGFAADRDKLNVGLKTTLNSIPKEFRHSSILMTGQGINATVMEWGDILLMSGDVQKERSNVYDDFTLAMLGYWTDNGAYHYVGTTGPNYDNMEEALVGIKEGMKEKRIPIRYIQWDDWWMEKIADIPGILSWTPKKDVFPSGFSDWLGMPLAMYAPEYASTNVWIEQYSWKIDPKRNTSIPIDTKFYMDLFKNGTSIGMKMFEQDFLCSYGIGRTTLTNSDVMSGKAWLTFMDAAAREYEIKMQLCMPDAYHLLQSTTLPSVTNARGTGDNTRDYPSILSMGMNTFLFYALGIFTSRDNAWTSDATVNQSGCGNAKFCFEPNSHLDNVVAVLSGGPYGIGDGLEFVNRTVAMYCCRSDGLLLRPRWPLASLEFSFTDKDAKGELIWAAHDEFGSLRWSYIVGVKLSHDIPITPKRLSNGSTCSCGTMVAWEVTVGKDVESVVPFSNSKPFMLPASKPLDLPYKVDTPGHTHYSTAPVLSNGMVFLGETDKWASVSFGRVVGMHVYNDSFSVVVSGASSETAIFSCLLDAKKTDGIERISCSFAPSCPFMDQHGNKYCQNRLTCTKRGCSCAGLEHGGQLVGSPARC